MQRHILVADDDASIRELLRYYLTEEGYIVHLAQNGEEALQKMEDVSCHLAVVDVMMPKRDGWEVTEILRQRYDIPIILLTAKSELESKAKGFRLGTDDYIVKPFEPEELLYRIKALLRRYKMETEKMVTIGSLSIDARKYEVYINDETVILPLKEFQLLFYLTSHLNRTFTREQLIESVWGTNFEGDSRTVDVHIKRLRERVFQHVNDVTITTIRGLGYKLEAVK